MPTVERLLKDLGFVWLPGGPVCLGTDSPLPCRLEGHRRNEVPLRKLEVGPFWIARFCVSNAEYERTDRRYRRPAIAPDDRQPALHLTYLNALDYCAWMSSRYGLEFNLPTEAQWVYAAAPYGWEYPWGNQPDRSMALTRGRGVTGPLPVDDKRFPSNWCGLLHASGNVSQFILGTYDAPGQTGSETDGRYCHFKGGSWLYCSQSPGVHRRGLADVALRLPNVGIRLVVNL